MNMREYSDAALGALGLQTRRSAADYILPALGLFGVGVLVGAGLGLMFAPKQGRELRGDISRGLSSTARNVGQRLRRNRRNEELSGDSGLPVHDDDEDALRPGNDGMKTAARS
jgi:hypothetical protein